MTIIKSIPEYVLKHFEAIGKRLPCINMKKCTIYI